MKETVRLKDVYTIAEGSDEYRSRWTKVGIGFVNSDDSINIVLDAVPVNGRLHVRDRRPPKTKHETGLPAGRQGENL